MHEIPLNISHFLHLRVDACEQLIDSTVRLLILDHIWVYCLVNVKSVFYKLRDVYSTITLDKKRPRLKPIPSAIPTDSCGRKFFHHPPTIQHHTTHSIRMAEKLAYPCVCVYIRLHAKPFYLTKVIPDVPHLHACKHSETIWRKNTIRHTERQKPLQHHGVIWVMFWCWTALPKTSSESKYPFQSHNSCSEIWIVSQYSVNVPT